MTKLVIAITRGIVRDVHARRRAMFAITVAALVMLFVGAMFSSAAYVEHPVAMLCYWGVCAWLTLSAALLAVFDLLLVRAHAAREKRKLRAEIFGEKDEDDSV